MDKLILHNERTLPLTEAHLSPGQAGLLAGWGVFTTLRIYQGQPFEFHRHWHRMAHDATRLNLDMTYEEEAVRQGIVRLAAANHREEGMARVWFVRTSDPQEQFGATAAGCGQATAKGPQRISSFSPASSWLGPKLIASCSSRMPSSRPGFWRAQKCYPGRKTPSSQSAQRP